MRLIPPVTVKKNLTDLSAGELIRFKDGSDSRFALVGEHNDRLHPPAKCLFLLAPTNDGRSEPHHIFPRWGPMTYVSYGMTYYFEANHEPEVVDFDPFRGDSNGVLLVFADRTLLEARAMPQTGNYATAYYDIETHEVVERPGNFTTVGLRRWSLYLGTPEQRRMGDKPLISFNAVRQV